LFNWRHFLDQHQVPYSTRGPNLSRQMLGLTCPFCGEDDPSAHMGVPLVGQWYSCWRNKSHRGRQPHKLIMQLLHCSWTEANAIVGSGGTEIPSEENFLSAITKMLSGPATEAKVPTGILTLPKEFKPLTGQQRGLGRHCVQYMRNRGYQPDDIDLLEERYHLKYATTGPFAYRVIWPIYMHEKLVTWTGRAITKSIARYKTLSKHDNPPALEAITDTLFDYPHLKYHAGEKLFICEGPMDSMRVGVLGEHFDIHSTCLFTKSISDAQVALLEQISRQYDQRFLLLDSEVRMELIPLLKKLEHLNFQIATLPPGIEDPALLTLQQVRQLGGTT
jgi:hypothetical protein